MRLLNPLLDGLSISCRSISLRASVKKVEPWQLYEPPPLNPKVYPEYGLMNFLMESVDFVPLEKFNSFAHRKARQFGFTVTDSYALPPTKTRMITMSGVKGKPGKEFVLSTYHRIIRLSDVPAIRLQLYLSLMYAHAPVGIKLTIKKHEQADEEMRYIPDEILESRKAELASLDDPKVRKMLGWE